MDFSKVVRTIADYLNEEGAPFAMAGAFALHAYGLGRATVDIDFVVDASAQKPLVAFLESLGYETLHVSAGFSNHLHADPELGRVDFIYVSGETSRRMFTQSGTRLRFGDREVPVPRPEHLVAMKVHAMKNDPGRRLQEMADIRFLLQWPGIDENEVREYFEKAGLPDRYDEIRRTL
jgi:hypothetical protein